MKNQRKKEKKENVKKVLIVAYWFPPSKEMAAARPFEFAKYLPQNGWKTSIVTGTKCDKSKHISYVKIQESYITRIKNRRLLNGKKGFVTNILRILNKLLVPIDDQQSWKEDAKSRIIDIIKKEKIDLILITCMPFSAALLGPKLVEETGVPYILDFRDAWTMNPYRISLPGQGWIHKILERKAIKSAAALLTTTPTTSKKYQDKYPTLSVHTIYNGYDPELFDKIDKKTVKKYDNFTITYLGSLDYNRKPDMILEAIKSLVEEHKIGNDFQLNICGRIVANYTNEMIDEFGLTNYIKFKGFLPREEALLELKKSHASLLIQGDTGKRYCLPIAGKTFEYLRIGNPIICIAPDGDNSKVIRDNSPDSVTATYDELPKLKRGILKLYEGWKKDKIKFAGKDVNENEPLSNYGSIEKFSRKKLTKELAKILDEVYKKNDNR